MKAIILSCNFPCFYILLKFFFVFLKLKKTCKDSSTGNSERWKKERKKKEEMGRQHRRMDWTEVERGNQTCGRQREMERTGS